MPRKEPRIKPADTVRSRLRPLSQAERVLRKFGGAACGEEEVNGREVRGGAGARRLSEILEIIGYPKTPASIYRWTYPRSRGGTGGLIPTSAWPLIHLAARYAGILITAEDRDPGTFQPAKIHRHDTWE